MASEWFQTTIGEQVTLQRGIDITRAEQRQGSVPVVSSGGVTSYHDTTAVKGPGVILGRKGVVGSVYYISEDFWPHDTTLWVRDFHGNNRRYVYYFFRAIAHRLSGLDVGSANPTLNRNHVHPIRVLWPKPDVQNAIVEVLSSLDDKIALLRETNATLEAIAQAIFKSWFVDFDPVRARAEGREPEGMPPEIAELFPSELEDSELGKIPKGWRVVSVGEVADIIKGKSYKSSELVESDVALVTLKSFTRGGGFRTDGFKGYSGSYKPEQVIKPGDCVVAYTDVTQQAEVIGRAAMVLPSPEHKTLVASLDIGVVRPTFEHLTTAFLYFLLRGERYVSHIYGYTSGTTVLHLAKEGLPVYQFVLPPAVLLKKFEELAVPIMGKIGNNHLKTVELSALRDALLPRLISGMLRVIADENMT